MDELEGIDATAQAELVRTAQVTPGELVESAIRRAEARNPALNAITWPLYDDARSWAAGDVPPGPFAGVPFLAKDLGAEQAGQPLTMGNAALRDAGHRAAADSELGRRLRDAGLITIGRTNTPEAGMQATTQPIAFGPTCNPWDLARSTNGSSGGSAAAVAAGIVPMAHGNDAAGSIRMPAAWCGVVGLKPSRGRTPPMEAFPTHRLPVEFALTRTIRDCAGLLDAVGGPRPGDLFVPPARTRPYREEVGRDPGRLRIAVCTDAPGVVVTTEVVRAVDATARTLDDIGHEVTPGVEPPHLFADADLGIAITVMGQLAAVVVAAIAAALGRPVEERDVEPYLWWIVNAGIDTGAASVAAMEAALQRRAHLTATWWDDAGFDLLLVPTVPDTARPLDDLSGTSLSPVELAMTLSPLSAFTRPFNSSGEPAVSLPLHQSADGLPIGIQLVAPYGREDRLLQVAGQLEAAMPWIDRRPELR